MGLQGREHLRVPPSAVSQDTRHGQLGVVVQDRSRHAAEEGEGRDMAVAERLGRLARIGLHEDCVAVGQIDNQEVDLALNASDDSHSFSKVCLGMTRSMMQRHKHLTGAPAHLADVILHNRVAAFEAILITQPLQNALGRMALLLRPRPVLFENPIDDACKRPQLGAPDRL